MTKIEKVGDLAELRLELRKLEKEHGRIDKMLSNIEDPILDTLLIQRLKKEKLFLKDKINKIANELTPDIIA